MTRVNGLQTLRILRDCGGLAPEIADLTRTAFRERYGTGDAEVAIVAALREAGDVVVELAALEVDVVVGHAMFSRATADPPLRRFAALGPVAVCRDRQRRGIGDSLIRAGLEACVDQGIEAVIVLGDPNYYGRFGFRAECVRGIACAFAGDHLQGLDLVPGTFDGVRVLRYAGAFHSPDL